MQLFRREALNSQRRRLLGNVTILQPVRFMTITLVLVCATMIGLVFLYFAKYAEKKPVRGSLVPAGGLITINSTVPGTVAEIHVEQGQLINRGDALVTMRSDVPDTQGRGVLEQLNVQANEQESEILRRIALVSERSTVQQAELEAQILATNAEIEQLEALVGLNSTIADKAARQAENLSQAARSGAVPGREAQASELQSLQAQSAVVADMQRLANLRGLRSQLERRLPLLPIDRDVNISDLRLRLSQVRAQRDSARLNSIQSLNAPVSGTITDMRALLGATVSAGEVLVAIRGVSDPLVAELIVPTAVAASVEPGKQVNITYDAFPYQRFGVQTGEILKVSESVYTSGRIGSLPLQSAAYKATVRLDSQTVTAFDKTHPLQPGLELNADIVLQERRLLEIFFRSLIDVVKNR